MPTLAATLLPGLMALFCLVVSLRHFARKGAPWNNAWLYASEKERQQMDTAPLYRQTGAVFALLCALFALLMLEGLLQTGWLRLLSALAAVATVVYAIASTVAMGKSAEPRGKKESSP